MPDDPRPLTRPQQLVVRRVAESRATVPDHHAERELVLRPDQAADDVLAAIARALRGHPDANGAYRDAAIEHHVHVHLAVMLDDGETLAPAVVRDADTATPRQIAETRARVTARVADGTVTAPELRGATASVFVVDGADRYVPVVIPGQAATFGLGRIAVRPVVVADGTVAAVRTAWLTLATDHRVVYGAAAGAVLQRVVDELA